MRWVVGKALPASWVLRGTKALEAGYRGATPSHTSLAMYKCALTVLTAPHSNGIGHPKCLLSGTLILSHIRIELCYRHGNYKENSARKKRVGCDKYALMKKAIFTGD